MGASGRPGGISLPRHARRPLSPPPPRRKRPLDVALGVSRRRRQVAYLSIAAGVRLLRPALRRVAMAGGVLVAAPVVLRVVS